MTQASTTEGGHQAAVPQPTASAPATAVTSTTMKTFTQAELDAHVASATAASTQAERVRISTIQAHPKASAHPGLVKLGIDTGMTAEQASAVLSAATTAAPAAPAITFSAVMDAMPNPQVSGIEGPANAGALDPAAQASALAASILGNYRAKA